MNTAESICKISGKTAQENSGNLRMNNSNRGKQMTNSTSHKELKYRKNTKKNLKFNSNANQLPPRGTNFNGKAIIIQTEKNIPSPNRRSSADTKNPFPLNDMTRLLEDEKAREERMLKRLELLKEHAKLIVTKHLNGNNDNNNCSKEFIERLSQCKDEISSFKTTMDSVLKVTNETHSEIKRTQDLVNSIDNSPMRIETPQRRIEDSSISKLIYEQCEIKSDQDDSVDLTENDIGIFLYSVEYELTNDICIEKDRLVNLKYH